MYFREVTAASVELLQEVPKGKNFVTFEIYDNFGLTEFFSIYSFYKATFLRKLQSWPHWNVNDF